MSGIARGLEAQPEDVKDIGAEVRRMFPGAPSIDRATELKAFEAERDRQREELDKDRERKLRARLEVEQHENGDGR